MPNPTLEDFKTGNRIGYCSAIKRSKLLEIGGYSPRMTTGYEDLHLGFNLLNRGAKIITIPEILWLYRTKEKSMIHDAIKHHAELMAQIHKDFPEVKEVINNPLPK
jgi:GT2 family glycosyltransferase